MFLRCDPLFASLKDDRSSPYTTTPPVHRCWGNNESGTPYLSVLKKQLVLIGMEIEMECRICIHSGKNLLTQPFPTVSSHFHWFPTKADCDFIEVKPNIPIKSSTYVRILCRRRTIFVKYTLQNGTDCLIPRQSQQAATRTKTTTKTYFNAILRNRSSKFEWKRRERIYRDGARTRWTIEQTTKHKCMRRCVCVSPTTYQVPLETLNSGWCADRRRPCDPESLQCKKASCDKCERSPG